MNEPVNDQPNDPMQPTPSGMAGWFSIWMSAVTKPNEQTFAQLANSSEAKLSTAFIWVFIGSLVSFFLNSLVQGAGLGQLMQQYGLDTQTAGFGRQLITAICGAPVAAVIAVIMFAIGVGIIQFLARMLGGRGTFEQLAYVFAAISTPFSLISGVLGLLSAIPYVGLCFSVVTLLLALYVIVLEVMAVKAVNQFGLGPAAGAVLLPFILICCCLSVGVIGIIQVLGPQISDTFNQINNGLIP